MKETITIQFDGGSRGNPGIAAAGVVLSAEDGTELVTLGKFIGNATNNVAEYMGLIFGLREAGKLGATKIIVRGDSELIIKQMRGEYRVKNPGLKDLYDQAQKLVNEFESVKFEHNLRHHNATADRLANLAMDRRADVADSDGTPPVKVTETFTATTVCPSCGCEIQVKKTPKQSARNGKFICPCGSPMNS